MNQFALVALLLFGAGAGYFLKNLFQSTDSDDDIERDGEMRTKIRHGNL